MNYNSLIFWVMFGVIYLIYWKVNHRRQNLLLLVASYIFYGFWDYRFLFLVLLSTIIDFIGGLGVAGREIPSRQRYSLGGLLVSTALVLCTPLSRGRLPHQLSDIAIPLGTLVAVLAYGGLLPYLYALPEAKRRRGFLIISMVANLAILAFFKYFNFFLSSLQTLLHLFGITNIPLPLLNIILPAGISFYTFQAMSYTIDIWRKEIEPTSNFQDFALFVCFFPHLVAGPIMRGHTLLPQVIQERTRRQGDTEEGLILILVGMFKKLVIADNMAPIANAVFYRFTEGTAAGLSGSEVLLGVYAFAFQIYGDFSGYSSIARGISRWLGFELAINFRNPYLAVSPSDFWQRWHISLSSWLRDYLYIPLGGNRQGTARTYGNLLWTMVLGGLWHGASGTFIAWGFYHGMILCLFRFFKVSDPKSWFSIQLRRVLMFHLVCLGWLFFRADTLSAAFQMLKRIVTPGKIPPFALSSLMMILVHCIPILIFEALTKDESQYVRFYEKTWLKKSVIYSALIITTIILNGGQSSEFIYFQF